MGIEFTYRRLKKAKWTALQKNRDKAESFLFAAPGGLEPDTLSRLVSNPEAFGSRADEMLQALESPELDTTRVDLEKDWHALHFLLTGDPGENPEHRPRDPLHNAVMGGHDTQLSTGYGPVRCLEAQDVRDIAKALSTISVKDLSKRFSAKAFNEQEIYPNPEPGGWTRREVAGLLKLFPRFVKFFKDAAVAGEIVLIYAA